VFELLHLMYDQNVPVSAKQHGGSCRGQYGIRPGIGWSSLVPGTTTWWHTTVALCIS